MEKVNVFQNRAKVSEWRTFTFVDPSTVEVDAQGKAIEGTGVKYVFRLRALGEMELSAAREFGEKLVRRYLTGGYVDQGDDFRERPEILAVITYEDGSERPVEVSEEILVKFAILERAQGLKRGVFEDAPQDGCYNAKELALIAETATPVWFDLQDAWRKVKAEAAEKKVRPAQGGQQITPPSALAPGI